MPLPFTVQQRGTPSEDAHSEQPQPGRPRTSRRRLDTGRPDTSTSSVGEVPQQTFFPDNDDGDLDEEAEDDYQTEDDEDADVFAFERPQTAAVTNSAKPGQVQYGNITAGPDVTQSPVMPRIATSKSQAPTTAATGRSVSFGFNVPDEQDETTPGRPVNMETLTHLSYRPSTEGDPYNIPNPNTTAFTSQHSRWNAQRPSVVSDTLVGHSSTAHTKNSPELPSPAHDYVGDYRTPLSRDADSKSLSDEIELANFRSRPGTQATWNISELRGASTIPDGITTKGDGLGGIHPKWPIEEANSTAGVDDLEEDSRYPEVRASVSNMDDPEMPALTIRSLVIGLFFAVAGASISTFFSLRGPGPLLLPLAGLLIAYPLGRFMAWALPLRILHLPRWLGGFSIDLNPGPFNIKEHAVIAMMTNISFQWTTGLHVATAAQVYLDVPFSDSFALLFTLAAQMGGFGLAGLSRRLLVWPASMIWPYNLVITTSLNTLHAGDDPSSHGITRFKFFMIALGCVFLYHFFPGYIMTCLSYFSWVCWIKPDNVVVNQLFGVATGLGMGVMTFDWSQILVLGNPLNIPWWAQVNVGVSFVIFYWFITPLLYYTNVWDTAYLPMSTSGLFDRFGQSYNITAVINSEHRLDIAAYQEYSPVYISVTYAMTFTIAFALTSAAIVYTILHYGERIYCTLRSRKVEDDDIHMKLMRQYPEVPDWWYAIFLLATLVLGIVAVEVNKTGIPVYSLLVALGTTLVYYFPAGFLYARASSSLAINLIAEIIPGYMLEGSILGNMVAKSFTTQTMAGALQFTQDLKLGHYMKIPPRVTFFVQILAAVVACLVSVGVKILLFATIDDICSPTQANQFTCPYTSIYYNSGLLWGAIGPRRLFSKGSLYWPQTFMLVAGVILPIPIWWLGRRYPKRFFRQIDLVVMLNGLTAIPPATGVNYASFLLAGFVFQYAIRHRNYAWWSKYTFVLAGALDVGTLAAFIVIFLGLGLTSTRLDWGGNTIYTKTADWLGMPYRSPPVDGFGPTTGWT